MNHNSENGITLIELLVAGAIAISIIGFAGTAIFQFLTVTRQGSDVMTSVHQVQNAGHWVTRDGQMASTASGGSQLVLTIPEGDPITYSLDGMELNRNTGDSELMVARNVTDLDFDVDGDIVTMSITSSSSTEVSEQSTYKVYLRPTGGG